MKEYENEALQDLRKKCYTVINQFIEDRGLENIPDQCTRDWCNKHYDCTATVYRNSMTNYIYISDSALHNIIKAYGGIINPFYTYEANVDKIIKALGIEPKDIINNYKYSTSFIGLYLPKIKQELDTNNNNEYDKIPWGNDVVIIAKPHLYANINNLKDDVNEIIKQHSEYNCVDSYFVEKEISNKFRTYAVYIFKKML